MKVYELMSELAKMPAGAQVRISTVKDLDEIPEINTGGRDINFEVQEVTQASDDRVLLDGWYE